MRTNVAPARISRAVIFILLCVCALRRALYPYTLEDRTLTNHCRPAGLLSGPPDREHFHSPEAAKVQAVSSFRRKRRGVQSQVYSGRPEAAAGHPTEAEGHPPGSFEPGG